MSDEVKTFKIPTMADTINARIDGLEKRVDMLLPFAERIAVALETIAQSRVDKEWQRNLRPDADAMK